VVVPNVVLFREIALHDTAPICRYGPDRFTIPRAQAPDRSMCGGLTGRRSMRILNTACASFLFVATTKSTGLYKISH
jgi:hypothetical protein